MGEDVSESVEDELDGARDALHDARVLIDSGGSDAGVINRLYYATFHAAQAALYSLGENPASHGDVRRQFGQHIVLPGRASRDDGRLLGRLYDHRWEADYGGGEPDVELGDLYSQVEGFLTRMTELVESPEG